MNIIAAVIIFSAIVLFHEFGHFLAARSVGITVLEFSLGMGPRLLSHVSRKSQTRYSLKLLPFGGSCMMKGEDTNDLSEGAFGSKKIWQRIMVVAAGPVFNFLLAFLFAMIIIATVGYDAPVPEYLTEDSPLKAAGIEVGDEITSIDGRRTVIYRDIAGYCAFNLETEDAPDHIAVTWIHDGEEKSAQITPARLANGAGYTLGIYGGGRFSANGNVLLILKYSAYEVKYWISTTIQSLMMIGKGRVSLDDMSGPVGIVEVISDTYEETKSEGAFMLFLNMLNLAILLSANLGVMNLIPFPALDGGRIVLLVLEKIRGRKLGENVEGYINLAGLAVLMTFMMVVMMNDVRKIL